MFKWPSLWTPRPRLQAERDQELATRVMSVEDRAKKARTFDIILMLEFRGHTDAAALIRDAYAKE